MSKNIKPTRPKTKVNAKIGTLNARSIGKHYEQLCHYICQIKSGEKNIIIGPEYVVLSKKLYDSKLIKLLPLPHSNRATEWFNFSELVVKHIENYTVPQYGDKPTDPLHTDWSILDCTLAIKEYASRSTTNARGPEEEKRYFLKIAHYAAVAYFKLIEKK
jgi:hypothetical protein